MVRTEDIKPFSEHRAHLTENFKHVQETGRPLFVTHNGRTAGVLLSPESYDALTGQAALSENIKMIDASLVDIEEGRTQDARAAIKGLAKKHGINL